MRGMNNKRYEEMHEAEMIGKCLAALLVLLDDRVVLSEGFVLPNGLVELELVLAVVLRGVLLVGLHGFALFVLLRVLAELDAADAA